jgi:hypothetical protein
VKKKGMCYAGHNSIACRCNPSSGLYSRGTRNDRIPDIETRRKPPLDGMRQGLTLFWGAITPAPNSILTTHYKEDDFK